MFSSIFLFLVLCVAVYFGRPLARRLKRQRLIASKGCQGPSAYPQKVAGLGTDFSDEYNSVRSSGNYLRYSCDKYTQLGRTWTVTVQHEPWLFTSDPDNIRHITTARTGLFAVEPSRKPNNTLWIGDGMVVSDGSKWKQSRTLFRPMFSKAEFANLSKLDRHIERLFRIIPADGTQVDLQALFKRFYLDVSTELFFGESANALDPEAARFDIEEFDQAFATAMKGMGRRLTRSIKLGLERDQAYIDWQKACQKVHNIFDSCIERAIAGDKGKEKASSDSICMAAELAQVSDDRLFIRNQLLNVFIGAKDTAAIGISNVFFHLARHPGVWKKLREEVLSIPGDDELTYERLKGLSFLRHTISESLRLWSPVIMSIRHVSEDTVLPKGGGPGGQAPLFVAAGTRLEVNLSGLHYDEAVWGPDYAEFRPERWESMTPKTWEFIPFMGGIRVCPAQQMIQTQYALILARFVRRFATLQNHDAQLDYVPEIVFSQQSKNGVQVGLYDG